MLILSHRQLAPSILLFASTAALSQPAAVQGSPYTATEKTTWVQKLADGTTITRVTTTTMIRDSQGRTLRKENIPFSDAQGFNHFVVTDPATHTTTVWTTMNKQATRVHLPDFHQLPARPSSMGNGSASGSSVMVTSGAVGIGTVGSFTTGAGPALLPGVPTDPNLKPTFKHEKLDGKTIAGVYAEGVRTTTYPTGFMGNDRPIVVVHETWTSPDLKLIVYSTNDDPRSGLQTTELTNLDRSEPDPTLFQVPTDYQVKDQYPGTNAASN
jgi:hypothetical protein